MRRRLITITLMALLMTSFHGEPADDAAAIAADNAEVAQAILDGEEEGLYADDFTDMGCELAEADRDAALMAELRKVNTDTVPNPFERR